ncbi:MAG TPA: T9SS type A sorting domain-containing protein [Bacteroidia bacterium]|nr:T9SS type A sorting domain-containing protein [Bacteroidia bacterium]
MKKVLCFCFFMSSFFVEAQTSVYHPFPDSNAVWNFNHGQIWGCGPPLYNYLSEHYSYMINGDTIINSQQYHKLYIPFVQSNCPGMAQTQDTGYMGCVRQDTALRRVYYIYPNSSVDSLLYDFNMQVGDTLRGVLESFASPNDTVITIDSVLVGGDYRKRWYINSWYNIYLIEGIGSTYGLTEPSLHVTDGPDYSLICFTQNEITLYPDTATSCNLIDGVINITYKNAFSLFPNPATKEIIVQSSKFKVESIKVLDLVGKVILSMQPQTSNLKPQTSNLKPQTFSIDVSKLTPGIYFITVTDEEGNKTVKKVVKM